jgi:hypothetical protein
MRSKLFRVFVLVFVIGTLLAAPSLGMADDDDQGEDEDEIVLVKPSGDTTGVKDTTNIQEALEDEDEGIVIHLTAGTFYICGAIDAPDFDGTLKGAGKDVTTINVVENKPSGSYLRRVPYWDGLWGDAIAEFAVLFNFDIPVKDLNKPKKWESRTISIMDMTIKVAVPHPATPHWNTFAANMYGIQLTTAINNICYISGGNYNTRFENLKIEGGVGDAGGYNLIYPLGIAGGNDGWYLFIDPLKNIAGVGNHIFKNCEVEHCLGFGCEYWNWKGPSVINIDGVTMTDVYTGTIVFMVEDDVEVIISNSNI